MDFCLRLLCLYSWLTFSIVHADGIYQSYILFSTLGKEFRPRFTTVQLLSSSPQSDGTRCSAWCNQLSSCRTFDYDFLSKRCRLFDADAITGSIIASSSSTSFVGTVRIAPSLFTSSHNQPCSTCQNSRYESCSTTKNTCQCPPRTYWTGSICALQLFQNDTCTQASACRSDLNLTCPSDCYGEFSRCVQSFTNYTVPSTGQGYGVTVAGACNGTSSANQTLLTAPADVLLLLNQTIVVANNDGRVLAFARNNRTAQVVSRYPSWVTFMQFDEQTSNLYSGVWDMNQIYIFPSNRTIPPDGLAIDNCTMGRLPKPTGIIFDSTGNMYVASGYCHWVVRWAPNATNGTLVAGSSTGNQGGNASTLRYPYGLALDEANSYLYVADRANHRIQRFTLGGSPNAVTIAGTGVAGNAPNQLNTPTEIYLSKIDGSLIICDMNNHRIQRWAINATSGVTLAGDPVGSSGNTPYLLTTPYALALDATETFLYVSDSGNNRVQRFNLT